MKTQKKTIPAPPSAAARAAGLIHVSDNDPGIRRLKSGSRFRYVDAKGKALSDPKTLSRIKAMVIPPAWTDVWICPRSNGHIQATGRDARGRKQYRYHDGYRAHREEAKYEHMLHFAKVLPSIRARVRRDMMKREMVREKALAAIIYLLETTLIRIGNSDYARQNKSYGLTTLHNKHVAVEGTKLRFRFKGKSGKDWDLELKDPRIAKIVRTCQTLPGQDLFAYYDANGKVQDITSTDVNIYLKEISDMEISAKDFRTWAGTVLAAQVLAEFEPVTGKTALKKNITAAIKTVAAKLGNTPAICRKCYVHPVVLNSYHAGSLSAAFKGLSSKIDKSGKLAPAEMRLLKLLKTS